MDEAGDRYDVVDSDGLRPLGAAEKLLGRASASLRHAWQHLDEILAGDLAGKDVASVRRLRDKLRANSGDLDTGRARLDTLIGAALPVVNADATLSRLHSVRNMPGYEPATDTERVLVRLCRELARDVEDLVDASLRRASVEDLVDDIEQYGGLCGAAQYEDGRGGDAAQPRQAAAELLAAITVKLRGAALGERSGPTDGELDDAGELLGRVAGSLGHAWQQLDEILLGMGDAALPAQEGLARLRDKLRDDARALDGGRARIAAAVGEPGPDAMRSA